ncbi:hypothetical protein DOTSEDRAFT_31500 [Dothistroma septosporum NZE10]|uniref:Uncharacterized protein n=1 Tax=Dothistroma septosporum (strain NZE10 / CBS 128990) TaxID=675120 RepID=N1PX37_DOTSN|nr:hypothetical protein DOTSEDRAFT_31500 [Dothistroma septosporum NZE10]
MHRAQIPDLSGDLDNVHFETSYSAPAAPMLSLYTESSSMDIDQEDESTIDRAQIPDGHPKTAPPNSAQQPLTADMMSPTPSNEKKYTVILKGIFGPQGPALPVEGSQHAIDMLAKAVSDGLAVLKAPHDGDAVVESALSYLQARGVVPDYHEEGILQLSQQRLEELDAQGLTADQFTLSPREANVLDSSYMPFLSRLADSSAHFDVEKVLILLKVFARYWQHTGKRYQMLVVTQASPHKLEAQIFSTQEQPNETIYFFRSLRYNGVFGGAPSYSETWMPITLPRLAPRPARELDTLGKPLNQVVQTIPKAHRPRPATKAHSISRLPVSSGPRERAKPQHSGIDVTAYQELSPEQVFKKVQGELEAGTLHPDGVAGERLLLFAVAYSNAEIRNLLLPYCERYNQTVVSSNNVYNGRILPAIKKSMLLGQNFDKAKANFDHARRSHDLRTPNALRAQSDAVDTNVKNTARVTHKRKRATETADIEGDDAEAETSDGDMEANEVDSTTSRKTRGAKPRASYRIVADEESEDDEAEDTNSAAQNVRLKAIRKRAKMNDEEDDDDDDEFELEA